MKNLDELIAARVKAGDLTHLTLFPSGKDWQANVAGAKKAGGYSVGIDNDPVMALRKAFNPLNPGSHKSTDKPKAEVVADAMEDLW